MRGPKSEELKPCLCISNGELSSLCLEETRGKLVEKSNVYRRLCKLLFKPMSMTLFQNFRSNKF